MQHFRYETKHLDQDLQRLVELARGRRSRTIADLSDSNCIISFVSQRETGEGGYTIDGIYPLRQARVVRALLVGDVLHFWFALGSYLDYTSQGLAEQRDALVSAVGTALPSNNCYASRGKPYQHFVVNGIRGNLASTSYQLDVPQDTELAFQTLVRAISPEALSARSTVFVQFLGLVQMGRDLSAAYARHEPILGAPEPDETGYLVRAGKLYSLEVALFGVDGLDNRLASAAVTLEADDEHLSLMRATRPIRGRYDRFRFVFEVKRQEASGWTDCAVRVTPGFAADADDSSGRDLIRTFAAAEWNISIYVRVRQWTRWLIRAGHVLADILIIGGVALFSATARELWTGSQSAAPAAAVEPWLVVAVVAACLGVVLRIFLPPQGKS